MALTEGNYALEFLLSESPGQRSREAGVVLSGQNLVAGTVVAKANKVQAAAPIPAIVGTGTGAMTALTFGQFLQTGSYFITLLATSSTAAFSVVGPDGVALSNGAVGTAYVSDHLSFLISSAGTMTIGDVYTVVVTAGGTPVLVGTGTGVVSAFSLGPDAINGTYRVQLLATSATAEFEVISPDGDKLKRGQVATAYVSSHVNFTLSNAGTMTSGDYFNIVVTRGTGKLVAYAQLTYDGRNTPVGILSYDTNATSTDQDASYIARGAEVSSERLNYGTSVSAARKLIVDAQLANLAITVRYP